MHKDMVLMGKNAFTFRIHLAHRSMYLYCDLAKENDFLHKLMVISS